MKNKEFNSKEEKSQEIDSPPEKQMYETDFETNTIYDRVSNYLNEYYEIQFNEISLDYQIRLLDKEEWEILNLDSLLIELVKAGNKISKPSLETYIRSHNIKKYNPISEYLKTLPEWDGFDHIGKLCSYVKTDSDHMFSYHMKKWFARAVLCALESEKINKHCIVLTNKIQNSGKSTFLRFLIPKTLKDFLAEDLGTDKDSRIKLCKNFIINLDELSVMDKADINALKALISKTHINDRLPYGKRQERLPRICSFVGSTNLTDFLNDESGSVRWIVFEVVEVINFDYSKEMEIDKVWAQAYYLAYNCKGYNPELTRDDVLANEKRNKRFTKWTREQEVIDKYYEITEDKEDFMTATDVEMDLKGLGMKLNHINIGRALSSFGFKRIKHPSRQVYGYLVKKKNDIS